MGKIPKFRKALFLNFSGSELWSQYWYRVDQIVQNKVLIAADNKDLDTELKDAEALLLKPVGDKINKDFIDKMSNLKYIGMMGTGTGGIDSAYCKSKKITVTNINDYATEGVVEITFGMIFDQVREIERAKNEARKGDYSGSTFSGIEIKGKNFGVIGLGHIGSRTAEIAKAFGANVRYWSRERKTAEEAQLGIEYLDLHKLLETSDFVTLNISYSPETKNFLDGERISLIKKGAVLVNPSPMELINFEALIKRLNKNDMTFMFDHSDEMEPKQLELLKRHSNCIIHLPIGFTTKEATATKQGVFLENMENFLQGAPSNVVNLDFRIVKTPLVGPGYEPVTATEREQWLITNLRPYKKSDHKLILLPDNAVYPTASPVTPETLDFWYSKNPEFGIVYEIAGKIVGTCTIVPLNRLGWENLIKGKIIESELGSKTIFDNKKDKEIALHFYHVEKFLLTEKFYSRILLDLNKLVEDLRKTNPDLKIIGLSSLCTSSPGLDLFQDRFGFLETGFVSKEHIFSKGNKLYVFDEKVESQTKLQEKLSNGFAYHHRVKMLVLYPSDFSLVWSYLKK